MVDALCLCHAHRDVNPSSILFGHYGDAKLADFGLAIFVIGVVRKQFGGSICYDAMAMVLMAFTGRSRSTFGAWASCSSRYSGASTYNFAQVKTRIISGDSTGCRGLSAV
jgi:serine/threonine protein kinase